MQGRANFRNSDLAMSDFDGIFGVMGGRLRNSLSHKNVGGFEFLKYRETVSVQQIPAVKQELREKEQPKSARRIQDELAVLQQKLNLAKSSMKKSFISAPGKKETSFDGSDRDLRKSIIEQFTHASPKPKNITTFNVNPYLSIKNNQYYLSEVVRAIHEKNSLAVEHITTSIQFLRQCQDRRDSLELKQDSERRIILPQNPAFANKKTLVLDLDQTLIHCLDNAQCEADLRLKLTIENTLVDVDITIRPYALTFLKKIAKRWQVIIFTASHQEYADGILDEIDPEGSIFQHRLYRQHCTQSEELYIKDLSRINRDLRRMVLVDNAAYSYCLQVDNGIPILPFYDGKDFQLSALEGYLQKLQKCKDVRELNSSYFKLRQYCEFSSSTQLIQELYVENKHMLI